MLTEAELIRKMDDNGIGTDATIATHIQTIQVHHNAAVVGLPSLSIYLACSIGDAQDRGYANKMGANGEFVPTTLGVALVDAYNSMPLAFKLSAPQLRAKVPLF
jgi:DNA topoisomerase-3